MAIVGYVVLSPRGSQERCTSPAHSIGRDGHKIEEACPPLAQTEVSHPRGQGLSERRGADLLSGSDELSLRNVAVRSQHMVWLYGEPGCPSFRPHSR